jgi:hypothetical protein
MSILGARADPEQVRGINFLNLIARAVRVIRSGVGVGVVVAVSVGVAVAVGVAVGVGLGHERCTLSRRCRCKPSSRRRSAVLNSSEWQVVPAVEDLCETCRPFLCVSRLRVTMCRKLPSCIGSQYCARPSIEIDTPAMKSSEIQTSSVLRCNPLRSLLLYLIPKALLGESVGMFFVQGAVKKACKVVSYKNRSI